MVWKILDTQLVPYTMILLQQFNTIPDDVTGNNQIHASDVTQKWGGKNKWVMLQACNILDDYDWGNALTTSHGILGYSTTTGENSNLPNVFFDYAINQKMPIVEAYRRTTKEIYNNASIIGVAVFKTDDQYNNEQFPGVGYTAPDGDPTASPVFYPWHCNLD
jgi:Family of unknown function (DUF6345)